jgi:sugar phosphate isomerase/epimerase
LEKYEQAGIDSVELGYCPDDELPIEDIVDEYAFDFIAHNYFRPVPDEFIINLSSPDEDVLQRSISYICDSIDFCAHHEIEKYTFHSGFRIDPDKKFRFEAEQIPSVSSCMELFLSSFDIISQHAEERGVTVAIENNVVEQRHVISGEPVVLLADTEEFRLLFERANSEILLDTGHLKVASETLGFDRDAFIDIVEPHVDHIHLHTNNSDRDEHRPVEPNEWAFDVWQKLADTSTTIEAKFDDTQQLVSHLRMLSESQT